MCDCQGPFKLFPFPTEKMNPERRLQWANNISRNSLNGTLWIPNKDSRVCNLHFVVGEPTAENPDPTLQLGHNKKTIASKRLPPTPRDNSLLVRSRKRAKRHTVHVVMNYQYLFLITQLTTWLVMVLSSNLLTF